MSLDELMELAAADSRSDTETTPIPKPLPTTPAAPRPLNPAASRPTPAPAPQPAVAPVLADVRRIYDAVLARARLWLKEADNGLIAATALIAVLLLVVVATL